MRYFIVAIITLVAGVCQSGTLFGMAIVLYFWDEVREEILKLKKGE